MTEDEDSKLKAEYKMHGGDWTATLVPGRTVISVMQMA
jgi:hypothetical protein